MASVCKLRGQADDDFLSEDDCVSGSVQTPVRRTSANVSFAHYIYELGQPGTFIGG